MRNRLATALVLLAVALPARSSLAAEEKSSAPADTTNVMTAVVLRHEQDISKPPTEAEIASTPTLLPMYDQVRAFKNARRLLIEAGVPFEPNVLLTRNWRKRLQPVLRNMRQMQGTVYHSGRLKGVQLADVFHLPETMTVESESVIIANKLQFSRGHVTIKGNHPVHLFVMDRVSAAGGNATITIDTSGPGRAEWLDSISATGRRNSTGFATTTNATQDNSGIPGQDGSSGQAGAAGIPGPDGVYGPDGECGGDVNGRPGLEGNTGGGGGKGLEGTAGFNGAPASDITISIPPGDTNTWSLKANGGAGGRGGEGGPGGSPGPGGTGGRGGDGAACPTPAPCRLGRGGDGGRGGAPGKGGDGADGKKGGDGGKGGIIHVTYESGFDINHLTMEAEAGAGGAGGAGGQGFPAIVGGTGGAQGQGGSWFSCGTSNDGAPGAVGPIGTAGSNGVTGANGNPGAKGETNAEGHANIIEPSLDVPIEKEAGCLAGMFIIHYVTYDGGLTWHATSAEFLWCTLWA